MRAALIGCGHIGGSLALALRQAGSAREIIGFDSDPEHLRRALERGVIDVVAASAAEAVVGVGLCIVAVPVRAAAGVLGEIASSLPRAALCIDVGSTKRATVASAEAVLPGPERFVGCHPIAGTERSGPNAADADLFRGRKVLLTPTTLTSPEALLAARKLWEGIGAEVRELTPDQHDRLMAAVSHLPHLVAFALARTVGDLFDGLGPTADGLAAAGLRDATRIAASDPVMWRDIFMENRENVLDAFTRLSATLAMLRDAITCMDADALTVELEAARRARQKVVPR